MGCRVLCRSLHLGCSVDFCELYLYTWMEHGHAQSLHVRKQQWEQREQPRCEVRSALHVLRQTGMEVVPTAACRPHACSDWWPLHTAALTISKRVALIGSAWLTCASDRSRFSLLSDYCTIVIYYHLHCLRHMRQWKKKEACARM